MPRINPPLPALGGPAYRIEILLQEDGQEVQTNIDYAAISGVPVPGEELALLAAFDAQVFAHLAAVFTTSTVIHGYKVTCLTDITRIPKYGAAFGASGTVAGNHIPLEMSAIMRKLTNTKGQHGAGRMYFPAVPSSFLTPATNANELNAAAVTAYGLLGTDFLAALTVGAKTFFANLVTRPSTNINYTLGQIILSFTPVALLGTQRRRRPGRGK